MQSQANNKLILLTSTVCVSKVWHIPFLCAVDLRRRPKTTKNMSMSHTVALGDMLLRHEEFGHVSLFETASKTNNSDHISNLWRVVPCTADITVHTQEHGSSYRTSPARRATISQPLDFALKFLEKFTM